MALSFAQNPSPASAYAGSTLACCLCALLCLPLLGKLDQANIVMLFLLTVAASAAWLGRGPGILAAFLSVGLFDVLFVEPRFSLAVQDTQYLVTFTVMLLVALLISQLATRLREQLLHTRYREQQTYALYDCAHRLTGAMTLPQVTEALLCLCDSIGSRQPVIYLPANNEQLDFTIAAGRPSPPIPEQVVIRSCYDSGHAQQSKEFAPDHCTTVYLPLCGATRVRGVLVMDLPTVASGLTAARAAFLDALASLVATAIERVHFVEVAQTTELAMQAERLRSAILSAVSHDIRTPLTVLGGLADTLLLTEASLSADGRKLASQLREQAFRLHGMTENLLDMARLQSGKISLHLEWLPIEEMVGASIRQLGNSLAANEIRVTLPANLPLLQADAILMERVLCNLLDNARRYSPAGSVINLSARADDEHFIITVDNAGSGFPQGTMAHVPVLFAQAKQQDSQHGCGLGLAICRSIIEAHGGNIILTNPASGGARVECFLPRGTPPSLEPETDRLMEPAT